MSEVSRTTRSRQKKVSVPPAAPVVVELARPVQTEDEPRAAAVAETTLSSRKRISKRVASEVVAMPRASTANEPATRKQPRRKIRPIENGQALDAQVEAPQGEPLPEIVADAAAGSRDFDSTTAFESFLRKAVAASAVEQDAAGLQASAERLASAKRLAVAEPSGPVVAPRTAKARMASAGPAAQAVASSERAEATPRADGPLDPGGLDSVRLGSVAPGADSPSAKDPLHATDESKTTLASCLAAAGRMLPARHGLHLVDAEALEDAVRSTQRRPVAAAIALWLRKLWRTWRTADGRQGRRQMRVVETLALGGRKQLMLISCGGERFLVGTGTEAVETIVRVRPEAAENGLLRELGARC